MKSDYVRYAKKKWNATAPPAPAPVAEGGIVAVVESPFGDDDIYDGEAVEALQEAPEDQFHEEFDHVYANWPWVKAAEKFKWKVSSSSHFCPCDFLLTVVLGWTGHVSKRAG